MPVLRNTDLTPANKTPGIYVQINPSGGGGGDPAEASTVLLFGEMLSSGAWAPGGVYDVLSEQDVIDGADGASIVGASTLHRQYRAAIAQVGDGNVRIKACPVAEPSGTAATYKLVVSVLDGVLATATNPLKAGTLRLQVAGDEVSVGFTTSDTASTIATALKAELDKLKYQPGSWAISAPTLTFTYNHKGLLGEDLPLRVYVTAGSGVYVGPGTVTYATNATGNGSAKIGCGTQTCTAAITGGDTPTLIAAAVKAALLLDDFPLLGAGPTAGALPLLYRDGRDVRRVAASVVTSTGTTAILVGGAATDGTGSATSFSYNGTQGASLPTLTQALANLDNAGSFGEWTCPWSTAGSASTGLTAIASQIETAGNGENQKNQHLTIASVDTEAVAAAIAASVTPALGSSLRYVVGHSPDAGQQGYELAARRAAMFAAWLTPATNSDAAFGGTPFQSRGGVPLNLPSQRIRATKATINAGIVDGLEPWTVVSGRLSVVRGRNTSTSTDQGLWDPSWIRQADQMRRRIKGDGAAQFAGATVKADGVVNQSGEITTESVEGWGIGEINAFEREGFFDGAAQLASAVKAELDVNDHSKINLQCPCSPKLMLHQLGVSLSRSAPALP